MKKFKKLFLSAAMLSVLCALGGGLTSNAAVKGFQEDFTYANDGQINFDTSTPGKWIDKEHKIANASLGSTAFSVALNQVDDSDVLEMKQSKEGTDDGQIEFRNGGSLIGASKGESVVIKTRIKASCSWSLYERQMTVYTVGKTYRLLKMRGANVSTEKGMSYQLGSAPFNNFAPEKELKRDEWHDFVFVLQNNGDLNEDNTSPDMIYAYLDGELLYETNFNDGDNFTGLVSCFTMIMAKSGRGADDFTYIDYLSAYTYNGATLGQGESITKDRGTIFELAPNLTVNDSESPISIPNYTVTISDHDKLKYENGKFEALALTGDTPVQVTFTMLDKLIPGSCTYNITIQESRVPIPVTEIKVANNVINDTLTIGINEEYELSNLFKANPSTADDTTLSYSAADNVISIENDILKGVSAGTTKLMVTANGGENVQKEIIVNVVKGSFSSLNGFTSEDSWANAEETHNGFTSKGYGNKQYSPVSVANDEVFGNVIKFTGVGGTNAGGSHLDAHVSASNLTANKDYKLTGWLKMDVAEGVNSASKIDIKLFNYYSAGDGKYGYSSAAAPYYGYASKSLNELKNGWVYFETSAINFDTNALNRDFIGIKVEIGTYNTQAGVDSYVTHLNLVELDTVTTTGWEVVNTDNKVLADKTELTQTVGATFQLNTVALPSSGVVNATYASSDETIATVDAAGLVTFLNKAGTVSITITNGGITKTIIFTVKNPATGITSAEDTLELGIADAFKDMTVTVTPADATSTFKVTIADDNICSAEFVGGKLVVVPNGIGTTTIQIVSEDNEEVALTITIVVKGYTVTFDVKGHGTAPETINNVAKLPAEFAELSAEGYIFGGWFLDADCTQAAVAGSDIEADTTLYAKWTAEAPTTFTITYNINGHGTAVNPVTNATALPAVLPTLTEEGWEFEGWYLDAACTTKAEASKNITEDTTLYAKWTEKKTENPGDKDPEPTPTPKPEDPKDSGVNVFAIVVPIVVVVVLAIAGALVYFLVFKKKQTDKE